jgi:hypothetical protein
LALRPGALTQGLECWAFVSRRCGGLAEFLV